MSGQADNRPIIKRKKVVQGGGHHGGAWKVAYADFVTAMMAFFMLMWLLNATTEQQRKGLADYFTPTIPINRVSGGGDGAFGGDSIFSENTMPQNGTGGTTERPTIEDRDRGDTGNDDIARDDDRNDAQTERFKDIDARLQGLGAESTLLENQMKHVVTRLTDEGLVIELFDLEDAPLFPAGSADSTPLLGALAQVIAQVSDGVSNEIAVGGHVRAQPVTLRDRQVWQLSSARAATLRNLLEESGIGTKRIQRETAHADRKPVLSDPMARRNNRLEVILLRDMPRN